MVRMTIEGVGFDQMRQTVVVLKDWEGKKLLPIWIGSAEARAIQIELEGGQSPRPLTHDLLVSTIASLRGRVTRIVINDLAEGTFYATIDIDTPRGMRHIDARPSDAIAVAVRVKCPLFVDGGALEALIDADQLGNVPDIENNEKEAAPSADEELERFRRLLDDN